MPLCEQLGPTSSMDAQEVAFSGRLCDPAADHALQRGVITYLAM